MHTLRVIHRRQVAIGSWVRTLGRRLAFPTVIGEGARGWGVGGWVRYALRVEGRGDGALVARIAVRVGVAERAELADFAFAGGYFAGTCGREDGFASL